MSVTAAIEVRRDDRRAGGRIEGDVARLLVPRASDLEEIAVPVDVLPDALARLLDLGPRPLSPAAGAFRVSASTLSVALAGGDDARSAPEEDDGELEALRALLGRGFAHWRVTIEGSPSTDDPQAAAVEVLDTPGGLWLLSPLPPEVELRPATSSAVFRRLAAVVAWVCRRQAIDP